jgi:hypothetical protein
VQTVVNQGFRPASGAFSGVMPIRLQRYSFTGIAGSFAAVHPARRYFLLAAPFYCQSQTGITTSRIAKQYLESRGKQRKDGMEGVKRRSRETGR